MPRLDIQDRIAQEDVEVLSGRRGPKERHAARMSDIGRIEAQLSAILQRIDTQANKESAARGRSGQQNNTVEAKIARASRASITISSAFDLVNEDLSSVELDANGPEVEDFNNLRDDLIATRSALNSLLNDVRDIAFVINNVLQSFR